MKKLFLLSMVVAFVLVGAQAFASPPIAPPVEGFIITSTTEIEAIGNVVENERYNWTYYEGWGKGPFYAGDYVPVPGLNCGYTGAPDCELYNYKPGFFVSELGFTEGAEIAYEQKFKADKGTTSFYKTFEAYSNPDAAKLQDNLMVHKEITYTATNPLVDRATHTEKLGLSVISMGAYDTESANPASGLLSLCPWAADGGGSSGGGYPPTNEGIAAASSFKVSSILNFVSDSKVNTTANPMLSYQVSAEQGVGFIDAGFVVELYEGPKGFVWEPILMGPANCIECELDCGCNPRSANQIWILPAMYGSPPLASRTSYKEYASADGTWSFSKSVKYESKMPAGATASTFPINQVLVP